MQDAISVGRRSDKDLDRVNVHVLDTVTVIVQINQSFLSLSEQFIILCECA